MNQKSVRGSDAFSRDRSTTHSTLGWDVFWGGNHLRTVETARVWVEGHDSRTSGKFLVRAYVCWGSMRGILVGKRNDRD